MELLPQGGWFGLTKSRIRKVTRVITFVCGAVLFLYSLAFLYIRYESLRTTNLLKGLQSLQIGESEQVAADVLASYKDQRLSRLFGYPRGSNLFQVDPWLVYSGLFSRRWQNRALEFVLLDCGSMRRRLGLRVWRVLGEYRAENGRITAVNATIEVEGADEWLLAEWTYLSEFRRQDSVRWGDTKELPEEMQTYRSHWTHLHMGTETGEGIVNAVTASATPEALRAARDINVECLTSFRGCRSLCALMPAAVAYRRAHGYGSLGWSSGSWGVQDRSCR